MKRVISELITDLLVVTVVAGGIAFASAELFDPAHAQTPNYRAEFAPITEFGSGAVHAVNPRLVTDMFEIRTQAGTELTVLVLASGEHIRTIGSIQQVAAILRVSVWLEDTQDTQDTGQ